MPLVLGNEKDYSNTEVASLLTLYESFSIVGILVWGYISDRIGGRRAPVLFCAMLGNCVNFYVIGSSYMDMNKDSMRVAFAFLGFTMGSYHMLSVIISADLGRE
jgi:sugar phosphate permease